MNRLITPTWLAFCVGSLHAETDAGREFNQLQVQREKALVAAAEPINRRYREALEQLLRRATQANDLETAVQIKAAIATLPQDVAKQLPGDWRLRASTGYTANVTFRADGTGTHSGYGKFQWHIGGSTLFLNPKEGQGDKFNLPIKDGKMQGVNGIGNQLTLTKE